MKKHTILCVDDDADDLLLLHETLQELQQDFVVVEARNGRQALDILQKSKNTAELPCLIILDINMPVLNGKETLTYIRKEEAFKSIPIVVFTTSGSTSDKVFCNLYGVEMITKPPNYQSFKTVVQKLLEFCTTETTINRNFF
jgi:CheY-like chemotaxis protein